MKPVRALMIMGLALLPIPALAHAHLADSTPANGSVLAVPPTQFMLRFSEDAHLTALSLHKEGETQAQKIAPLPTAAGKAFSLAAPKLSAGVYRLEYRVVAADDHHLSVGAIRFRLSPAP